jgi:hypothetical protein
MGFLKISTMLISAETSTTVTEVSRTFFKSLQINARVKLLLSPECLFPGNNQSVIENPIIQRYIRAVYDPTL